MTRLVDSLRELITPTSGLSLAAEIDGQIVGHALFTRSLLDAPSDWWTSRCSASWASQRRWAPTAGSRTLFACPIC